MMELLKVFQYKNTIDLVLTVLSLWVGFTSAIQLCQYGEEETHLLNLNMDSTPISGSSGMCSCRIQLLGDTSLSMYPDMRIPGCSTQVSLSDVSYVFLCSNDKIESLPLNVYSSEKKTGDVLWLFVTSTGSSQPMSGNLQIKTSPESSQFIIDCYNENTNTSETTQQPTTTTIPSPTNTITTTTSRSTSPGVNVPSASSSKATPSITQPSSVSSTVSRGSTSAKNSPTVDTLKGDNDKDFPVAAVAGGIAGGLLLILIIIIAVICFRRRNREPNLLENGGPLAKSQGHDNRAYDKGVPSMGGIKPQQNTQSPVNSNHVQMENDLYVSADTDNQPHHPQIDITNSLPGHYASFDDLNHPDKSEVESVEGSEVVITSSGDLYAVVDKSKKPPDHQDTGPAASPAVIYAAPHGTGANHTVSPSGDVYAVVDKKPEADHNHQMSPSGDVYAVVDKARPITHDEDEQAISRMMEVDDEMLGGGTEQTTAL